MADVIHLRCRHCGEPLLNRDEAYCPPCNLYLAYRAMPFLLGMLLLGHPATAGAKHCPLDPPAIDSGTPAGSDEETLDVAAMNWE